MKAMMQCSHCGSQNVTADALARWDVERQQWEASAILDNGNCDDCGAEGDDVVVRVERRKDGRAHA